MRQIRAMGFLAILVGFGLALGSPCVFAVEPLDLNRASLSEIEALPITPEQAHAIWEYREYRAYYASVYELLGLPGITQDDLNRLKPLVKIVPVPVEDEELQRVNEIYYRIRQWEAEEGASEALVDHWIDLAKDPVNINTASYWEVANLQNVSPPDAVAIYQYTRRNRIETRSALRNVPGLTYWGYYNARNFVRYADPVEPSAFRGSYQYRAYDTPSVFDVGDCLREDRNQADYAYDSWWDRLSLDSAGPVYQHKVRARWGRDIRAGALVYRGHGGGDQFDATKFHATFRNRDLGPVHLDNVIVGNYAVAFGQGLVMQNTDFYKPRNSGYGWEQRYVGILGDISQTQEFQLTGAATEFDVGNVRGIVFYSDDWKDAVLNPDGTANQYIVMTPRIENDDLRAGGLRPMRDVLHEKTLGGNLKYVFAPGTWIGLSGYEARYNREFKAAYDPQGTSDVSWMVPDEDEDHLVNADSEYLSSYTSPGAFRRVYGTEFQWVFDNVSFAGEYAGLDSDGDLFDFGDDPKALVVNGYASYSDLTILALYRDYDLDFENPYCRGFSEYKRYKGTILEDEYYLADPLYGLLYDNQVMPQAERGLYLSSRYRFSHRLTPSFEYDVWERKADGSDYNRIVLRLRFQPIYNIVMNLRHKWQGRLGSNWLTPQSYDQVESRFTLEYRLSKFDEVEFLFSRAWIQWPPRPRLSDNVDADGGHPDVGSAAVPSYAVGAGVTHNFNDWLRATAAVTYYDGFLWAFEDGEFQVMDGKAVRYWLSIQDRISDHLALRVRWTNDHAYPLTYVDARSYNENDPPANPEPDGWYVRDDAGSFRVQLDYSW
jgi:DNA uptake protein ComE-like DNA-binding protein